MDKENVLYVYNGVLFSLRKEILSYVTTQMNLEDTVLSEISQSEGKILHASIYMSHLKQSNSEAESKNSGSRSLGEEDGGCC